MSEQEWEQMQADIIRGLQLARKRLVEKTKREGGELVIYRDGKVMHVKPDEFEF